MRKKPRVVIVIPARLGSTRLPEKMLAELAGKPLVVHTYSQAQKAKLADEVIIATDDKKILRAAMAFGCKAVLSPKHLKTGSDRVAFVAASLHADVIVNLQGDEPLIHPKMIDQAIVPMLQASPPACTTLVRHISDMAALSNPSVVKVVLDKAGFALYFSRSVIPYQRNASLKPLYYKHIGIYAYQRDTLLAFRQMRPSQLEKLEGLEQLRLLENGYRIYCAHTTMDSQAVDTPEDLAAVRQRLEQTKG